MSVASARQKNKLVIKLLPAQDRFLFAPEKYPAMVTGLGGGKTFVGCLKSLLKCPDGPGIVVAPTFSMLRDSTILTLLKILDDGGESYVYHKGDGRITYKGSEIFLRSADAPERIRGINANWGYLDEAALMPEEAWEVTLGRIRVGRNPQAWITTTPAGFNWVYTRWVERRDPQYRLIQCSTRDNMYLPAEYVADLEANYTAEYAAQEIGGQFVAFEGLVYNEFLRQVHVREFEPAESWTRVRAVDYGYTNPFVCLWGATDEDKRLYIYDEHYMRGALIKTHASAILSRIGRFDWTVADWDAQANAELTAAGIPTVRAKKDVETGIRAVKARLVVLADGKPRLVIHPRCVNTLKEIGVYRRAPAKTGKNLPEEPVKESDHTMDALRYMVMEIDQPGFILV